MNIKGLLVAVVMTGSAAALTGCQAASTSDEATDVAANDGSIADAVADWCGGGFHGAAGWHGGGWGGGWHGAGWGGHAAFARPGVGGFYGHSYARFAPPAARYEHIGVAPSARHFWIGGYHRWNGSRYDWVGGRWDVLRPGHTYIPGRWDHSALGYHYVNGYWR